MTDTSTLTKKERLPIGIRQNNPGNIRINPRDKWQESLPGERGDEFVRFKSPQFGVRAMAKILIKYDQRGINTIREVISTWAPPTENDTDSYVDDVAGRMGMDPDEWIDLDSFEVALPLVNAIIAHENKNYVYKNQQIIKDGLRMAGIKDAPAKPLVKRGEFQAQAVASISSGAGVVALAAEPVKKAADGLDPFTGSPIIQQIVIILLTIAGGAALIGVIGSWLKSRKGL